MYSPRLFPRLTSPPTGFEQADIVVEPLSITHAIIDFEAVYVSRQKLHERYKTPNQWPINITLHDNIVDLGWHEKEFRDGTSFAYTVTNQMRSKCYGCIYIIPIEQRPTLSFWLRSDGESPLDEASFEVLIRDWLTTAWKGHEIYITQSFKER